MRDSFDTMCLFSQPESSRLPNALLPAAILACAALLAFIVLGSPAHPDAPQARIASETTRNLPAPVAQKNR